MRVSEIISRKWVLEWVLELSSLASRVKRVDDDGVFGVSDSVRTAKSRCYMYCRP